MSYRCSGCCQTLCTRMLSTFCMLLHALHLVHHYRIPLLHDTELVLSCRGGHNHATRLHRQGSPGSIAAQTYLQFTYMPSPVFVSSKRNWRRGRNNGSLVDWQRPRLPRSSRLLLPTGTDCNLYVLHVEHVEANQPSKATSAAQSPRSRTSKLDAVSSARHVVDETSKSHVACCEECRTPPSISDHAHRCELHAEFDWRPPAHCHGMTRPAAECKTKLLHSSGR